MASKRTNFSPESTQRTVKFLRDIIRTYKAVYPNDNRHSSTES